MTTLAAEFTFDPVEHVYRLGGRELVSVTTALSECGLVDRRFYTDEAALRGSYVHQAILLLAQDDLDREDLDPGLLPFVAAFELFMRESGFRILGCEERYCDAALGYAGTLDLRGIFPPKAGTQPSPVPAFDIVDVKTGSVPAWVGYQTAAYARLVPEPRSVLRRRWSLNLRADAGYTLDPLTKLSDERVFLSALTVTQAKRGLL